MQVRTIFLQSPDGSEVEHALESLDAIEVGVGEGVVEDDGETAVMVGGENFCEGEADSSGDLLLRAAAEDGKGEGEVGGADEFEAFDALIGELDAGGGLSSISVRIL